MSLKKNSNVGIYSTIKSTIMSNMLSPPDRLWKKENKLPYTVLLSGHILSGIASLFFRTQTPFTKIILLSKKY